MEENNSEARDTLEISQNPSLAPSMDLEKEDDGPPSGSSSPLIAAMSTVNLVVGVGILYLPATFAQCGVLMAVFLSAIVAYASWYTSQLIVRIGMKIKKYSYEEICQVVLGDAGYISLAVSCLMFDWGACLLYLLTIKSMAGETVARWIGQIDWVNDNCSWLATPEAFCLILCLPILWWLSLLKDLSALSFVSVVKAVVVSLTVITIFITSQTQSVQDCMEFSKWNRDQLESFFEDITDGDKVPSTDPKQANIPVFQKHLDTYLASSQDVKARWQLVEAIDTEENFTQPLKVRQSLRNLVNRENPEPREVEYNEQGVHTAEPEVGESRQQPPGMFQRLTFFSPYLFCKQFYLKLGTICFAFVFHDSIFSVYKSLEKPSLKSWKISSSMFMIMAFGIQVSFAIFVGLTFGTSTPDNVLTSSYSEGAVFPADNVFSQIIQCAFSVVLLLTYPACIVICREFVESIINLYREKGPNGSPNEIARVTQLILASVLVLLTVPFLFFPGAGELADRTLDLVGSFACGYMAFVLPSFLYWKVYGLYPAKGEYRSWTDRVMPYAVLVLGFYTCLVAPALSIADWAGFSLGEMPHPPPLSAWKNEM
jgi:amino acid permease